MTLLYATGDLVLESGDARDLLAPSAPVLREADIVVGHLEIPHLSSALPVMTTDVAAVPGRPAAIAALAEAGFDVVTLAGNHVFDFGAEGIEQTVALCEEHGLRTVGTGRDLTGAFQPLIVDTGERPVAIVSINCVGPRETWATSDKPGAAWIDVRTHYLPRGANPGGPPTIHTYAEPSSLAHAVAVVAEAARDAVVVVALHKGLVHQPVAIAAYEYEIAHAMVDAGASVVIGHHAHIMKGIEVYRGRPIFHGLGNFATRTTALTPATADTPERRRWARERRVLFGFEPDPRTPEYPFHPESRNTVVAVVRIDGDDIRGGIIPCAIDDEGRPVPERNSARGALVLDYVKAITAEAGLSTDFRPAADAPAGVVDVVGVCAADAPGNPGSEHPRN